MQMSLALMTQRRFLPLFVTQFLGAMNDNLFKTAMVLFVIYNLYNDPKQEEVFSGIASLVFIIPFFLLSAVAGQLADKYDKARMVRIVKTAEIVIMLVGGAGLLIGSNTITLPTAIFGPSAAISGSTISLPLMMLALLAMGVHSTFFGPIKYAILPQHLQRGEVLGGTGLVEAGTYISILLGTIVAGFIDHRQAAAGVLILAILGWFAGREVPTAPPVGEDHDVDWNIFRASWRLLAGFVHNRPLFLAILSISFFWMIGSVLFVQFTPLVKNVLTADKSVASLFLGIFSVGIAIGSLAINRMLNGEVSARFAPPCVVVMGLFVLAFHFVARNWDVDTSGTLFNFWQFLDHPGAWPLIACLLGISISGGMFVVPLYAFLTTRAPVSETARAVGANNLVNAGCMVAGSAAAIGLSAIGVSAVDQFIMTAAMCLVSAWLAWQLHKSCKDGNCPET
jgi:MFS family permease